AFHRRGPSSPARNKTAGGYCPPRARNGAAALHKKPSATATMSSAFHGWRANRHSAPPPPPAPPPVAPPPALLGNTSTAMLPRMALLVVSTIVMVCEPSALNV